MTVVVGFNDGMFGSTFWLVVVVIFVVVSGVVDILMAVIFPFIAFVVGFSNLTKTFAISIFLRRIWKLI